MRPALQPLLPHQTHRHRCACPAHARPNRQGRSGWQRRAHKRALHVCWAMTIPGALSLSTIDCGSSSSPRLAPSRLQVSHRLRLYVGTAAHLRTPCTSRSKAIGGDQIAWSLLGNAGRSQASYRRQAPSVPLRFETLNSSWVPISSSEKRYFISAADSGCALPHSTGRRVVATAVQAQAQLVARAARGVDPWAGSMHTPRPVKLRP